MKPLTQNELHQVSGGIPLAVWAAGAVLFEYGLRFGSGFLDGFGSLPCFYAADYGHCRQRQDYAS